MVVVGRNEPQGKQEKRVSGLDPKASPVRVACLSLLSLVSMLLGCSFAKKATTRRTGLRQDLNKD